MCRQGRSGEGPFQNLYSYFQCYRGHHGKELFTKFNELTQAICRLTFCSGFVYTQLTDTEQEKNGLVDENRNPILDPADVKQALDQARARMNSPEVTEQRRIQIAAARKALRR